MTGRRSAANLSATAIPGNLNAMAQPASGAPQYTSFNTDRPSAIVVGHERSGNHFLMNTLARAYGYIAEPWFNIDLYPHPINYFLPQALQNLLMEGGNRRLANVGKTHHSAEFFAPILKSLQQRFVIFYVHRDPADVMLSFWRYIDRWQWREGPRRDNPVAFSLAEPEGQMLRYQMHQRRNLLDRWAAHADGWVSAAENQPRMVVVAYRDLKDRYAETVKSFARVLGERPRDLTPPSRSDNVIGGTERAATERDKMALRQIVVGEVGATMRRLGYLDAEPASANSAAAG
jgi:hypothetical protein